MGSHVAKVPRNLSLMGHGREDRFSEPRPSGAEDGNPDRAASLALVDRIVKSEQLQNSETLCRLLEYLAHHTLDSPDDRLKEYRIATEILGRGSDFDPRYDASVRVQIGRLRTKLAEYYDSTGAHEPFLIDIPKGRYALSFERHSISESEAPQTELISDAVQTDPSTEPATDASESGGRRRRRLLAPAILITVLLLASGFVASRHFHRATGPNAAIRNATDPSAASSVFWSPFLHGAEPFVVFSNAAFVGDAESGMRYFDPARDSRNRVTYHYTGVGEVVDLVELNRLFEHVGRQFRVKPSGLFTLDDARNNNLIFVGSPTENTTLREIPSSQEFAFRRVPDGAGRWNQIIVDLHALPGEPSVYTPTPRNRPLDVDYAIISLSHGLDRTRWSLILAGTSTIGTEGAVDYVCNRNSLEQLMKRMNVKSESDLKPFEALLRVKVAGDVPIESQIIGLHRFEN